MRNRRQSGLQLHASRRTGKSHPQCKRYQQRCPCHPLKQIGTKEIEVGIIARMLNPNLRLRRCSVFWIFGLHLGQLCGARPSSSLCGLEYTGLCGPPQNRGRCSWRNSGGTRAVFACGL